MSTLTNSSTNKKRKKSDNKQQIQQVNKCLNEKRRREQENIYIEELAELISANFADMSSLSVKPDKCAILQETVNQIRLIKQREREKRESEAAEELIIVQQGEVSSSNVRLTGHEVYGPLLLEALDGFFFVVGPDGRVEYVTENVVNFTKFTREDILGESIYNFLHHGDHDRFSAGLMHMAIGWPDSGTKSRTFSCRLLLKPPDDQDETMEEKQQRISLYDSMQLSTMIFPLSAARVASGSGAPDSESQESDGANCMMCVARRYNAADKANDSKCQQFTTKLDLSGNIISVDTSGLAPHLNPGLHKALHGKKLCDVMAPGDAQYFSGHFNEVLTTGHGISKIYGLTYSSTCPPILVQTRFRLFNIPRTEGDDYILATHYLKSENEASLLSILSPGQHGASVSSPNSPANSLTPPHLDNSPPSRQVQPPPPVGFSELLGVDFEIFPPSSNNWDLEGPGTAASTTSGGSGSAWGSPPATKASPQQQGHPAWERSSPSPRNHPWDNNNSQPSTPFSAANDDVESMQTSNDVKDSARLRNLLLNTVRQGNVSQNMTPAGNRILKGLLNQEDEEEEDVKNALHSIDPNALGNNGRSSAAASSSNNNNMLLRLLNDTSDDGEREARAGLKKPNELLQQLLKETEDPDRPDGSANAQEDTLLKSLGFGSSIPQSGVECASVSGGRKRPSLESDDGGGGKRPHHVGPQQQSSMVISPASVTLANAVPQVSSSGTSKLCEKNKMLASLLAKEPTQTQIPPIPVSELQATPNERLSKVVEAANAVVGRGRPAETTRGPQVNVSTTSHNPHHMSQHPSMNQQQAQQHQQQQSQPLHPQQQHHQSQQQPQHQSIPKQSPNSNTQIVAPQHPQGPSQPHVANPLEGTAGPSGRFEVSADSSGLVVPSSWDPNGTATSTNDEMLSDILDQVIDIVPDNNTSSQSFMDSMDGALSVVTGNLGGPGGILGGNSGFSGGGVPSSGANGTLDKERTISAITKSLMQCESAVKNPPQYQTTMQPPCPPPVYPSQAPQRAPVGFGGPPSLQMAATRMQYESAQQQQHNQTLMQRRKLAAHAQQQKERLLQQQLQQVVVPSNPVPQIAQDHSSITPIDAMLGHSVTPPNVSLQRSISVPDSQLSPSYTPMSPQQQQQRQQQFQNYNAGFAGQQATRLSPLPGAVVANNLPPFQQQQQPQQLSPRVTQGFSQQQAQWSVTQAGNTTPTTAATRLSLQQQQNPMLNAQLTAAYPQNAPPRMNASYGQQRPNMRAAAAGARNSPFTPDNAPPSSPSPGNSSPGLFAGGGGGNMFPQQNSGGNFSSQIQLQLQQQQQLRLHRTMSQPAPATSNGPQHQQIPGHNNSWHNSSSLLGYSPIVGSPAGTSAGHNKHHHASHNSPHSHSHYSHQPPPQAYHHTSSPNSSEHHINSSYDPYPSYSPLPHRTQLSPGANNNMPSDYVRQELRAAVCARTQQQQQQQIQQTPNQVARHNNAAELDALDFNFELPSTPGDNSNRMWDSNTSQQQLGPGSSSAREESMRNSSVGQNQASLLQKLLSE